MENFVWKVVLSLATVIVGLIAYNYKREVNNLFGLMREEKKERIASHNEMKRHIEDVFGQLKEIAINVEGIKTDLDNQKGTINRLLNGR